LFLQGLNMWWPFAKRGTRTDAPLALNLPVALPTDLGVFGTNDACIKLWLPEKLTLGLDQLSASTGQSRPDVLRWVFFEHVYGRPAFETLKAWKKQRDEEERKLREELERLEGHPEESGIRYSRARVLPAERTVTAQLLGKSVEDFKLWLPSILKQELETLALAEQLGLSDYLRKTLVRIILGESFHHQWRKAVGKLPDEAYRFEVSEE
jgi:hypothetical protein